MNLIQLSSICKIKFSWKFSCNCKCMQTYNANDLHLGSCSSPRFRLCISYLESFELLSKHFWQTLHWYFCVCLVFLWPTRNYWVFKVFPNSWQSNLLAQNFACLFLLLRFWNNRSHWSQSSIFSLSLALELYSYKKQ